MLKLNEEGYRSSVGVSIKLRLEHETLSNTLNIIRNKVYGIWTDVNCALFYLEKQAKKAPHYAILDDQGIQDFILKLHKKKKVQLCLEFAGNYLIIKIFIIIIQIKKSFYSLLYRI